jgi:hypothetical protein
VSQVKRIRAKLGAGTGRAKLPEFRFVIARLWCVMYPVASCGETKIVASPPRTFPPKWQAAT